MICHGFLIFSILISVAGGESATTAAYNPTDVFLFNCGDPSNNTDTSGRNWTAEDRKTLPLNSANTSFFSSAKFRESGVPLIPYMKARIFRSYFTYTFPVSVGPKFLRLYFYPTGYGSKFDAVTSLFFVTVNGFTVLENFSADLTVKASKEPIVIKEFIVPVYQTPLVLTFTPYPNMLAFVNGIEIVSMPDRFYSKGGFDDVIANVGSTFNLDIDDSTTFETVYRLNVAGQTVEDTAMFRRWISDENFMLGYSGTVPEVDVVKINYTEKNPAYVAPEDVYATSRMMGNVENLLLNLNFNLTWLFPVDGGFNYLVRLHFCEILLELTGPSQRVFSIFIGSQMAKREMDVFKLSGGSRIPMYLDFSVYVSSQRDLRLDLHPFIDSHPEYIDAILNGVEILKMSDSDGNIVEPYPNPITLGDKLDVVVKPRWKRVAGIIATVIGSAIVLATLVAVLMLLMRHMKRKKNMKENRVIKKLSNQSKDNTCWWSLYILS